MAVIKMAKESKCIQWQRLARLVTAMRKPHVLFVYMNSAIFIFSFVCRHFFSGFLLSSFKMSTAKSSACTPLFLFGCRLRLFSIHIIGHWWCHHDLHSVNLCLTFANVIQTLSKSKMKTNLNELFTLILLCLCVNVFLVGEGRHTHNPRHYTSHTPRPGNDATTTE